MQILTLIGSLILITPWCTAGAHSMIPEQGHASAGKANALAQETSPYLLQHVYNPVDWHPWGPEAIEL
ncbi:MAG: thioredoxin domain-containing protein, partial [Phycisphaerales bacterium]|nr:thioredoxin domain-containing protein [Phycisphaerales bacterium]